MKNKRQLIGIFAIFLLELASLFYPLSATAGNLTVAKDTLQSSRMSFMGRVKAPTTAGSSHVWIYDAVSTVYTSISTAGLKPGDVITIGGGSYTIGSIVDADEFTTTTALASGHADDGDAIIYAAMPQHVITFKTNTAVNGGFFQVLIPASSTVNSQDGVPDPDGFDFVTGAAGTAINATGYAFNTPVATYSGNTGCTAPANYHCFEYHYTGVGGVGTDITLKIGTITATNGILAPAPSATRTLYTADAYSFKIKNFTDGSNPNTDAPTDEVTGKVAVIEPVRVTATVDPSITFKIEGTSAGSHCSLTTDVATSADAVPFGVLGLNVFKSAAQKITVSTNAISGYAVTAIANERMSNLAASPSYIEGTTCDTNLCTHDGTSGAWATATGNSGLGYTVAIVASTPTIAPTAPAYQHFPSLAATEAPFQIMSNATTADSQAIDVCYKIAVDATQPAGNYESQITYTATASF